MAKILGILNLTPDSFYDGGHYCDIDQILKRIEDMIAQGADIIDVGAESSRPGAQEITVEEEIRRLEPLLTCYRRHFSHPLSLDTRRSQVAEFGLSLGVAMINDISGLTDDPEMARVIGKTPVPTIVMHKQGAPKTMQETPHYDDVIHTVYTHLQASITLAKKHGISEIIIDPGIGFGKTVNHNLTLLNHLDHFKTLGCPILIGTSNKSFIGALTQAPVGERLGGSIASATLALMKGASYFRVHNVKDTKNALTVAQAILNA